MNKTHTFATWRSARVMSWALILWAMTGYTHAQSPTAPLQSLLELTEQPPTNAPPAIKAWKLRQNTKVLFVENHDLPMIDLKISFAAGSIHDGDSPGLATMVYSLFNEGSALQDATAQAKAFDRLGVVLNSTINKEQSSFSLRSLSAPDVREPALNLFAEMLGQPGFTPDGQRRAKTELIALLEREQNDPQKRADTRLYNELYPGQPVAGHVYGSVDSIERIDTAQLQAFYRRAYTAANAHIVIVGDLTPEQAQTLSQALADALPSGPALAETGPFLMLPGNGKELHLEADATQSVLMLAQNALPNQHPDALVTRIGHEIFTRMLNTQLREHHSVTYGVLSNVPHARNTTPWIIDLNTPAHYSLSAMTHIKTRFARFLEEGPTEQELNETKDYLQRGQPRLTVSNLRMRDELSLINNFNQPLDFTYKAQQIAKVTREHIKVAMNRHFSADNWVSIIVGPTVGQLPLPEPQQLTQTTEQSCTSTN